MSGRPRIVSLAPSVTSILFSIGARRDVVGVSKWCQEVAAVGRLPRLGDCWRMDVDELMRLRPTLLIGSVPFAADTVAKLLDQPVAFLALNPRSLADIEANIRTLGRLVNRARAAETLLARMRAAFVHLAKRVTEARKGEPQPRRTAKGLPRVYCEAWPNPRISSPPWVAELVSIAGGQFVTLPGARVTDEDVARANPDVIVLAWTATGDRADASRALRNPAWQDTPAVKNGRVEVIPDQLLNTPGPPLIEGARELFRVIHGGSRRICRRSETRISVAWRRMNNEEKMVTVVAALIESDGRLLVCQRRRDGAFPLMWELPGGKVEPGEMLKEALERELREELAIIARVGREVYRTTHRYAEMPQAIELVFFACTLAEGAPNNLAFEQIAWLEAKELPRLNFLPADRELIDLLATGALCLPGVDSGACGKSKSRRGEEARKDRHSRK
jgi:iron complex transport system substrate-binding protein